MALPKISFSWKPTISGREQWRWGLWLWVPSKHSGRRGRLRLMVRGILIYSFSLALAAYLAAATAWFYVLNQRPYNFVTWTDCVLVPLRWDEIKRKRGDAFISEGLAALENRRWSEAVLKLQAGLARSPDNRSGREKLGWLYIASGQRQRGLGLLLEGVERTYPGRDPMEQLLRLTLAGEDYADGLTAVESSLAKSSPAAERDRDWLLDQKARLLMAAGDHAQLVSWVDSLDTRSEVIHESKVVSLIELERFDEAREALAEWEAGSGMVGGARRIRVRLARDAGDLETMRENLDEMRNRSGRSPVSWIYGVVQEKLAGQDDAARERLEDFLLRFGLRSRVLAMAARPFLEIEAWELFDRVMGHARELGDLGEELTALEIDGAIKRGEFDRARELIAQLQAALPDLNRGQSLRLSLSEQLIDVLETGESAPTSRLVDELGRVPTSLGVLRSYAEALENGERPEAAAQVWALARARYPNSENAEREATRLAKVAGETEAVAVQLPVLQDGDDLDLTDPMLEFAAEGSGENDDVLRSSQRFLAAVDVLLSQEDWDKANEMVSRLRRLQPVWLRDGRSELLSREMRINLGLQNWPALVSNVGFHLDGTSKRALEAMRIVEQLDQEGHRIAAEQVLRVIERRHTDFPPARRMREQWAAEAEAQEEAETEVESAEEAAESVSPAP